MQLFKLDKFSFMRYLSGVESLIERCVSEYGVLVLKSVPVFRGLTSDQRQQIMVNEMDIPYLFYKI